MITGFQLRAFEPRERERSRPRFCLGPDSMSFPAPPTRASPTSCNVSISCLAASKRPKRIKESTGYESLFLEFEDHEHQIHQLERSLSGHAFVHRIIANEKILSEETLSEKHDPNDKKTVSALLLDLSNAWGRKIRQNQSGKTRT